MTQGEIIQELDLLMLEEGYIEVSQKNDMLNELVVNSGGTPKMYRKILMHLYSNYSYFEVGEDEEDVFFYNPYDDEFENFEEFKKEFNINY